MKTIEELHQEKTIIDYHDGNHGELHPKKNDFSNSGKPFITATQISELGELSFEKCQKLPEKFYIKLNKSFNNFFCEKKNILVAVGLQYSCNEFFKTINFCLTIFAD